MRCWCVAAFTMDASRRTFSEEGPFLSPSYKLDVQFTYHEETQLDILQDLVVCRGARRPEYMSNCEQLEGATVVLIVSLQCETRQEYGYRLFATEDGD